MHNLIKLSRLAIFLMIVSGSSLYASQFKKSAKPTLKTSGISQQNLLNIHIPTNDYLQSSLESKSDTLSILALIVSFQTDTLTSTTGDGNFILTQSDTTIIDPPPHDRSYFLAQIEAISHYFQTVSKNKLHLNGNVFPLENESSYKLPHQMNYYHPDTNEEETNQRLAELFQDAVLTADDNDQIPFSQYDIFVIFHAGVGQDFGDDFDETPNDIPSAFLNFDLLKKYLGNDSPAYQGVSTSNGFVSEGIILPETQNQQGSEFAVKGTFALFMGNQLGLPSLFNTETGASGIGAWGLMDAGASNYFGLIPAQPCAWSKVFLGWETPVLLQPQTDIRIAVNQAKSAPAIYKIPINAREYFLIENRNTDFNKDKVATGRDQFDHRLEFTEFGNFVAEIDTSAGERLGVITKVFDYDFNIPGSGILVWHIDDRIIEKNYAANTVNTDPTHRGVDLEEADGSQDIGQDYGFISPGSGSEFGVAEDAFYADNEIHKTANHTDFVSFSSTSAPSSKDYSGARSGVVLKNFSKIDSVMSFDYFDEAKYANFPQYFGGEMSVEFPPVITPIVADGDQNIFFTPGNNQLFAWTANGGKLIANNIELTTQQWDGKIDTFSAALFDTVSGKFTHQPVAGNLNDDDAIEIVNIVDHNKVIVWTPQIDDNRPFARRLVELSAPADHLLIWNKSLIIAAGNQIQSTTSTGEMLWQVSLQDTIADICLSRDATGSPFLTAISKSGEIKTINSTGSELAHLLYLPLVDDHPVVTIISGFLSNIEEPALIISSRNVIALDSQLGIVPGFPVQLNENIRSRPVVVDLDHDGFGEVLFTTETKMWAVNHNGTICDGFPAELPNSISANTVANFTPLVVVSNESSIIVTKDGQNNVFALNNNAETITDNFFSGGGARFSPHLSIADLNNDGIDELIDVNSDGLINVRELQFSGSQLQSSWLQNLYDASASRFNSTQPNPASPQFNRLLGYAYNYPNPTQGNETKFRFYLQENADISIEIYDLSGERVIELHATASGKSENEVLWNLDGIESGIYMARLEASNGSQKNIEMIKVAVVK